MITTYTVECWNKYTKKYEKFLIVSSLDIAERIFNKSYYKTRTRRLIKTTSEILYKETGTMK